MRDGTNGKQIRTSFAPVSLVQSGLLTGVTIDGYGYDKVTYAISTGLSDLVTITPELREADAVGGPFTPVADADLISHQAGIAPVTAATFKAADGSKVVRLGYRGSKQFTQLRLAGGGTGNAGLVSAVAILERTSQEPVIAAETVTP